LPLLYFAKIVSEVEIPKRALFKASEVCELARVQPYVLRSWESEFPDLGVAKSNGGPRVYRRSDVERVLRIKQLVFADGLTLAGVRRRIEEEKPGVFQEADDAPIQELLGRNARERLAEVKKGLLAILDLLSERTNGAVVRQFARRSSRPATRSKAPVRRTKRKARKRR
jgi:DNA-binding transcriptional MerR regulator